ncbi:MAG: DUF4339 domain-containing protein [Planctomycetales bacterium]|nr:DUF4339 domain-containing protein [Planctomycetales bacterium]
MGIRFFCPQGHKLNVKSFLAGKTGYCPHCHARVEIPLESTRPSSRAGRQPSGQGPDEPGQEIPLAQPAPLALPGDEAAGAQPVATPLPASGGGTPHNAAGPTPAAGWAAAPAGQPVGEPLGGAVPLGGPQASPAVPAEDPIAAAPQAVWYVRPASGGEYGPAEADVMRKWLAEGRVGVDSLVWREGWPDWRLASATFPKFQQ